MIKNSCAFSGHRANKLPWNDEASSQAMHFKRCLLFEIEKKIQLGCDTFLTGMCNGIDIISGELVLEKKQVDDSIKLVAVFPYEDFACSWNKDWRLRYLDLAEKADKKVLISHHFTKDCFKRRNQYLVDHAEHLIAVQNENDKTSGTFQTINFAKKNKLKIVVIEPKSLRVESI